MEHDEMARELFRAGLITPNAYHRALRMINNRRNDEKNSELREKSKSIREG